MKLLFSYMHTCVLGCEENFISHYGLWSEKLEKHHPKGVPRPCFPSHSLLVTPLETLPFGGHRGFVPTSESQHFTHSFLPEAN